MGVLECSVERCVHNMNGMCSAQAINVVGQNSATSKQTSCSTFEVRTFKSNITTVTNLNISGVVDQIFTDDQVLNPFIKCNVKTCRYNANLQCIAPGVEIRGDDASSAQQTECETFIKR